MEGWGVSSEKNDGVKYEHDEITCKSELSACMNHILAISAVLWLILLFSSSISARLAVIIVILTSSSNVEFDIVKTYTENNSYLAVFIRSHTIW